MESEQAMHPLDEEDHSVEDALKKCIEQLKNESNQKNLKRIVILISELYTLITGLNQ